MNVPRYLLRVQCIGCAPIFFGTGGQQVALFARAHLQPSAKPNIYGQILRVFHRSAVCPTKGGYQGDYETALKEKEEEKANSLITQDDFFERMGGDFKSKNEFLQILDAFIAKDVRRRGHVDFIYAALKKMPEFGVQYDIAVYNKLLEVFPKEVFVPRNYIQKMFNHFPRQQECGVQVLEQMSTYGVMPNVETKVILAEVFGLQSHPVKKLRRIMYWFPKFKHVSPYPVPHVLPSDPLEIAKFSLTRIAADLDAKITIYQYPSTDLTETGEEVTCPYIVGIQSPDQHSLLAKHNPSRPVFVEGPFNLWLRKKCVHYYLLRADPIPAEEKVEEEIDPELFSPHQSLFFPRLLNLDLELDLGDDYSFDVEDVENDLVYAMCMVGKGDEVTLSKWISGLQESCPVLGQIPTVFRIQSMNSSSDVHEKPEQSEPNQNEEKEPERSKGVQ